MMWTIVDEKRCMLPKEIATTLDNYQPILISSLINIIVPDPSLVPYFARSVHEYLASRKGYQGISNNMARIKDLKTIDIYVSHYFLPTANIILVHEKKEKQIKKFIGYRDKESFITYD